MNANDIISRAQRIRLVLTDNDGVLTDNGVYYSDAGEVIKRFSIRDGMGVERLRDNAIATGIVSGELSGSIIKRAEKLGIQHLYLGVRDKAHKLADILADTGLTTAEIAYIGDDYNDLTLIDIINEQGLTAAPGDAMPKVIDSVIYRCTLKGGHGAFREFAEWLLAHRQQPV